MIYVLLILDRWSYIMSQTDWHILILSIFPITELRASIPLAITLGMDPLRAFVLAVIGNLIPIIPILLFLEPLEKLISKFTSFGVDFQNFLLKTRTKGELIKKYGTLGLIFFVSVPLPGTGAWTGAILAWVLGVSCTRAFLAISIGVMVAGGIMTLTSLGLLKMASLYGLECFVLILVVLILIYKIYRKKRS